MEKLKNEIEAEIERLKDWRSQLGTSKEYAGMLTQAIATNYATLVEIQKAVEQA